MLRVLNTVICWAHRVNSVPKTVLQDNASHGHIQDNASHGHIVKKCVDRLSLITFVTVALAILLPKNLMSP